MSKIPDSSFLAIVAALPEKRFLSDDQIKDRCEQIADDFCITHLARAFSVRAEDHKRLFKKISLHARALRELLDPITDVYRVVMFPNHADLEQLRRVSNLLSNVRDKIDWIVEVCEPSSTSKMPALWKFMQQRKRALPASANEGLVEGLYNLFQDTTRQLPSRQLNGPFNEFARAFVSHLFIWDVTDDTIDYHLRKIIRQRRAPNFSLGAGVSDSAKFRLPNLPGKKEP